MDGHATKAVGGKRRRDMRKPAACVVGGKEAKIVCWSEGCLILGDGGRLDGARWRVYVFLMWSVDGEGSDEEGGRREGRKWA